MAIFKACMKWCHYLHGAKCTVYTNHKSLKYIYVQPYLNARQACWLERLTELDLCVQALCGKHGCGCFVLLWVPRGGTG